MKQSWKLCIVIFFFTQHSEAQLPGKEFRLSQDITSSQLFESTSKFSSRAKIGLMTGINTQIPSPGRVDMQAELMYTMHGFEFSGNNVLDKIKLHYVILPLMMRYQVGKHFSLIAGSGAGMLVSANVLRGESCLNIREKLDKADVFIISGLECRLANGFYAGLRYQHGLMGNVRSGGMPLKNAGMSITMAYKIKYPLRLIVNSVFRKRK